MPADKDFKRLVRGRMQKTGESYTAARATSSSRSPPPPSPLPRAASTMPSSPAGATPSSRRGPAAPGSAGSRRSTTPRRTPGRTGRSRSTSHEKYKVPGWWAQAVTVGYERIKGLRAVGQRRDGSFEANKSRTFAVPLVRLYRAFHDARTRARWLPGVDLTVRTATRGKSMRITWPDRTSVVVGFESRGAGKSQVAIQHGKLADRAAAARMKQYWAERLGALGEVLTWSS